MNLLLITTAIQDIAGYACLFYVVKTICDGIIICMKDYLECCNYNAREHDKK